MPQRKGNETRRNCVDCKQEIEYIPRRVRCIKCYFLKSNFNRKIKEMKDLFLDDD